MLQLMYASGGSPTASSIFIDKEGIITVTGEPLPEPLMDELMVIESRIRTGSRPVFTFTIPTNIFFVGAEYYMTVATKIKVADLGTIYTYGNQAYYLSNRFAKEMADKGLVKTELGVIRGTELVNFNNTIELPVPPLFLYDHVFGDFPIKSILPLQGSYYKLREEKHPAFLVIKQSTMFKVTMNVKEGGHIEMPLGRVLAYVNEFIKVEHKDHSIYNELGAALRDMYPIPEEEGVSIAPFQ